MKRIKWPLLLIVAIAIGTAFATRPAPRLAPGPYSMHTYSFSFYSTDHTRMYYGMDLTSAGYVIGVDYDCQNPFSVCTFIANPSNALSDMTGTYFLTADVPQSGIEDTGNFVNLDE
jgi:hypothetical protein